MDAERHPLSWAKDRLGMDDETFHFIIYECDGDERQIMACLKGIGLDRGNRISPHEKRNIRRMALDLLGQELSVRNLPVKAAANALARRMFGVDRVEWLRMDQIGEMVWTLRRKGVSP